MIRYFAVFIFCLCSTISFSQKNKNAGVMSSEQFINNYFKKTPPSKWKPGDQFIYIDSLLNITLTPSKRNYLSNISFRNKIFTFKEFREHTD